MKRGEKKTGSKWRKAMGWSAKGGERGKFQRIKKCSVGDEEQK